MKDTFCSSPWFHLRLNYNGDYKPCRWFPISEKSVYNIKELSLLDYWNSAEMRQLRKMFTQGDKPNSCKTCYYSDTLGKLNGRKRQLYKSAIRYENFDTDFGNSPHFKHFINSYENNGITDSLPCDLQIDIGSTCNSACLMCWPRSSSRLRSDYRKLNNIDADLFAYPDYPADWTKNPEIFSKFLEEIQQIDIKYIHLLGGETLYIEEFYQIAEAIASPNTILGTTTNGTIYNSRIETLIPKFEEFHLGISVEAFTSINDYVRYPSKFEIIRENILKYVKLKELAPGLHISLRVTPSLLTILDLDTVFEFCFEHDVISEDCHILTDPAFLKIEYLPEYLKNKVLTKLKILVQKYNLYPSQENVVNIRDKSKAFIVNSNTLTTYIKILEKIQIPDDQDIQMQTCAKYLKAFDNLRNNSLRLHNPEVAEWLTEYGY